MGFYSVFGNSIRFVSEISPSANAPFFDGEGESFSNYALEAGPWSQVTNLEPAKRASALILKMGPVARQVSAAAGSDLIMAGRGGFGLPGICALISIQKHNANDG